MIEFNFDRDAIGQRLREELLKFNLSQRKLANLLGCDLRHVANYLKGESLPNSYYLTVMHYAGCDIIYILTGERRA